jgi:hypothetical protein
VSLVFPRSLVAQAERKDKKPKSKKRPTRSIVFFLRVAAALFANVAFWNAMWVLVSLSSTPINAPAHTSTHHHDRHYHRHFHHQYHHGNNLNIPTPHSHARITIGIKATVVTTTTFTAIETTLHYRNHHY